MIGSNQSLLGSMQFNITVFIFVFIVSLAGGFLYRKFAIRNKIMANPNFRTLHEIPIPIGGGIVFSVVFVTSVFVLWMTDKLSEDYFWVFGVGAFLASLFGFLDDLKDIRASRKFVVQVLLGSWVIYWFDGVTIFNSVWLPVLVELFFTGLFLVWIINAYNFIDGIDGMAASGAFFVTGELGIVMLLTNGSPELAVLFFLMMASVGAFMIFNWPPASIFMGDAGSVFLGYLFGSLILITVIRGEISIWTWFVVLGYYFADTTFTQISRLFLLKNWFIAHRSHAYQNLARITGSHLKITGGVAIYHIVWLLPLSLWTAIQPEMAVVAAFLAVIPGLVLAYKYGPLFSSS